MTRRHELDGVVRSWLREDGHEDADRVLFSVLDELDTTPQRHASWLARRFPIMNSATLRLGIAAVAVVVVALLGVNLLPGAIGDTTDSSTPPATPMPAVATPNPADGDAIPSGLPVLEAGTRLEGGTYLLGDPFPIQAAVTVPEGWFVSDLTASFVLITADADTSDQGVRPAIAFWLVDFIPDSCPEADADPTPQPSFAVSAAGYAGAIAGRPGFARIEMTPVTLDGIGGVEMELRPALGGLSCSGGYVRSYRAGPITRQQYPGDLSRITILDIGDQVLLVDRLYYSENSENATSEAALAELADVYESINFAP